MRYYRVKAIDTDKNQVKLLCTATQKVYILQVPASLSISVNVGDLVKVRI